MIDPQAAHDRGLEIMHVDGGGQNTFRLNFSNASVDRIAEGIRRLAAVLKERFCVELSLPAKEARR